VRQYLAVLEQPGWRDAVRAGLDPASDFFTWFAGKVTVRLGLTAFTDETGGRHR
jgi:hypothetical protein